MATTAAARADTVLHAPTVRASTLAYAGAVLLLLVAPFERIEPLLRLPWQSVSNVELVVILAGGSWALALLATGERRWWRTPLSMPWFALVLAMGVAALLAPSFRANALHMTGRVAVASGVFLLAVDGSGTERRRKALMTAAMVSGLAVAALAILEFLGVPAVIEALQPFRDGAAVVGEQLRATGPLQYPTITSMYLEIAVAFALAMFADALELRADRAAVGLSIACLVLFEAIVVTFTRAGLITVAISLAIVAWRTGARAGSRRRSLLGLGTLAAAMAVELAFSHSLASTGLRMTTEGQDAWYQAEIEAPTSMTVRADQTVIVPITITNTGRATWDSAAEVPIRFSYHWLMPDDDRIVAFEGDRTDFEEPIAPGSSASLAAVVRAPRRPGTYRLLWDIALEGRLWFSTEADASRVYSRVTVTGAAVDVPLGPLRRMPPPTVRAGRLVLWRAAARLLASRPLVGVGPDNYRLLWGPFAPHVKADTRVHTNNMYLEIAVGAGALGLTAFAWLLWSAFRVCRRILGRIARGKIAPAAAGLVAALAAIAVHGLVDSFLGFTPIYVLIAVTLGLAVSASAPGEEDADRV